MTHTLRPVFIFSLPRSGSTLLQRILGAHQKIQTASEPWLLLPVLYGTRKEGVYSEYNCSSSAEAISDFLQGINDGQHVYDDAIRSMAMRLYEASCTDDEHYFLDKTPRYHLIVEDLIRIFPDAKFIFLWRHPLATIASALETFGRGKWRLYDYNIDYFKGFENLVAAWGRHQDKAISIKYEDLIQQPETCLEQVFDYLELDYSPELATEFSAVQLKGGAGDPTGVTMYSSINSAPLSKWKSVLSNPVRRIWAKKYINWLGEERLSLIGYDYSDIKNEIDESRLGYKYCISDFIRICYGYALNVFHTNLIKRSFHTLIRFGDSRSIK